MARAIDGTRVNALTATVVLLGLCLIGCKGGSLNAQQPEYIKHLVAYKEGYDALMIYVILADARGAMTTASGVLDLDILPGQEVTRSPACSPFTPSHLCEQKLFHQRYEVSASHFVKTTVGQGAWAHEAVLLSLGRIPYREFSPFIERGSSGRVRVRLTLPDGTTLNAEEVVLF